MSCYTFGKTLSMNFDAAIHRVTQQLALEGFGVLSDIDVAATLKTKLDHDMPPYRILGACNPQFAHQALLADPKIGALLPCNVVVRLDPSGRTHVEFMDPEAVLRLVDHEGVAKMGAEVRQRLLRVMDSL
jgi:uncharacterized protein (DUF302 family)